MQQRGRASPCFRHTTWIADELVPVHIPESLITSIASPRDLTAEQVVAILRIAYLAADIDLYEDPAERAALDELAAVLWRVAGIPPRPVPPVSPLPIDDEERRARIAELVRDLSTPGARELAYALAYVLAVSDLALDRPEPSFLEALQLALDLDDLRASELAATAAEAITPGVDEASSRGGEGPAVRR